MNEQNEAMMALVRGVVALSAATRELAAADDMDMVQIARMKAKTAEISAAIANLQPDETCVVSTGDIPEPLATSASSQPTQTVSGLDELFGD